MKASIIMFIRDSREMLRRQILYMNTLDIPKSIELVIVDHANNPPLEFVDEPNFNAKIVRHHDTTPWIVPSLVNFGRKHSEGEYLQIIGVDHMISSEWIKFATGNTPEYAHFLREYALLDGDANLIPLRDKSGNKITQNGACGIVWVKTSVFDALGGYDTKLNGDICGSDKDFRRRYGGNAIKQFRMLYMLPEKPHKDRPYHLLHQELKRSEMDKKFSLMTAQEKRAYKKRTEVRFGKR